MIKAWNCNNKYPSEFAKQVDKIHSAPITIYDLLKLYNKDNKSTKN